MSPRLTARHRAMRKLQDLRRAGVAIVAPGRPAHEQDKHVLAMYEANERGHDEIAANPFARVARRSLWSDGVNTPEMDDAAEALEREDPHDDHAPCCTDLEE